MPSDPFARLIAAWLRVILPAPVENDVVGDLLEDYDRRGRGRRRWLLRQALNLSLGLRSRGDAAGRWRSVADQSVADVRYAVRGLRRAPTTTSVAILSLALGMSLTTAVYSVVDGVLLRPLPYHDSDRIVRLREVIRLDRPGAVDDVTRPLLGRWIAETRHLESIAVVGVEDALIRVGTTTASGAVARANASLFEVLSVQPLHGRLFGEAERSPDAPAVAVLGHQYWQQVLGGRPDVIGQSLSVAERSATIIGVLPPTFGFPSGAITAYILTHVRYPDPTLRQAVAMWGPTLVALGRARPGVDTATIEVEGLDVWRRMMTAIGVEREPPVIQVRRLQEELSAGSRPALLLLMTAATCVLLITCINLTSILLARATVRQREMALRAALGATRWSMSRVLGLESLIITVVGGALGLAGAHGLLLWLPTYAGLDAGVAATIQINGRVVVFVAGVTGTIGAVLGVLPVWQAPATRVKEALAASQAHLIPGAAFRAESVRSALVILQVSLAVVLVLGAALLARSLTTLMRVDLGMAPEQAASFQVRLPAATDREYGWRAVFVRDLLEALAARPGVAAVGFSTVLPLHEDFSGASIRVDGGQGVPADAKVHREVVSPDYFRALGMRVVGGRGFSPADSEFSEPVIVVNETFARTFVPHRSAVDARVMSIGREWYRIIGVVADKRHMGPASPPRAELYHVLRQAPPDVVQSPAAGFVIRTAGSPDAWWSSIRDEAARLQPGSALHGQAALAERVWSTSAQPRFYAAVSGVFATLALVTAAVGLYGVLAFAVERRRLEIGVRRALGATPSQIASLVMRRGMSLVAIGLPLGAVAAALTASSLQTLLFGVEPLDPPAFAGVLAVMVSVASLASYLPARRATTIEPLDALREE